jgi:hypothetical protein
MDLALSHDLILRSSQYLSVNGNARMRPHLEHGLRPGARVISYKYAHSRLSLSLCLFLCNSVANELAAALRCQDGKRER